MEPDSIDASSVQSMEDVQQSGPATEPTSTDQSSENQSRPPPEKGSSSGSGGVTSTSSRKRRTPASITPNACTSCKKARAKCDGGRPACKRCFDRHIEEECHYEVHAKTAKEQMMREIQRLQRQTESLIGENAALGETNAWIEQIMESLKDNGHGTEIIDRLKRGDSHEQIAMWLRQLHVGGFNPTSPNTERRFTQAIEQLHRDFAEKPYQLHWTNVVKVPRLVEHLINLYLTWIHPVHMLFDQRRFEHSFRIRSEEYCSASLVNVICAMSCHLLHDSWNGNATRREFTTTLRDRFMYETKIGVLDDQDYKKMTTVQTYAIMFLVDLSSGRGLLASSHLRLAVENLLAKTAAEQTPEAQEVSYWGILTMHTAWSGFTYQKPSAPLSTTDLPLEKLVKQQKQDSPWRSYKKDESDNEDERLSHALETASEHAKLFRIIHAMILLFCGGRGKVNARRLLQLYERYLSWKEALPPDIADLSGEPLPHVLFLHIQYYTALVLLFQPLLQQNCFDEDSYLELRQHVLDHARNGRLVLDQYQAIYSTYFLAPLQIFCMVHICEILVRYDIPDPGLPLVSDIVKFCLNSLEEIRTSYPVADALQQMFRSSLKDQGIPIPSDLDGRFAVRNQLGPDDLLDACTRPTYRQPIHQLISNLEPNLGQDFVDLWRDMRENRTVGKDTGKVKATRDMNIQSVLNR